ncbi:hypothetical protein CSPX01_11913 [Colletotrichum filicis]|nr:hypothetical protein CSPX01_11913 [Colletotrichum filicis]
MEIWKCTDTYLRTDRPMLRSGNATRGYTQSTRNFGYRYVSTTCMIQMDPLCTSVPAPAVITLAPKTGQGPGDLTPHHRLANAAESNRTPPRPLHHPLPSIRSSPYFCCGFCSSFSFFNRFQGSSPELSQSKS